MQPSIMVQKQCFNKQYDPPVKTYVCGHKQYEPTVPHNLSGSQTFQDTPQNKHILTGDPLK